MMAESPSEIVKNLVRHIMQPTPLDSLDDGFYFDTGSAIVRNFTLKCSAQYERLRTGKSHLQGHNTTSAHMELC